MFVLKCYSSNLLLVATFANHHELIMFKGGFQATYIQLFFMEIKYVWSPRKDIVLFLRKNRLL